MIGDSLGCFQQRGHLSPGPQSYDQNLRSTHFWTPAWEASSSWGVLSVAAATWAPQLGAPLSWWLHVSESGQRFSYECWHQQWEEDEKHTKADLPDTRIPALRAEYISAPSSVHCKAVVVLVWFDCPGTRVHVFRLSLVHEVASHNYIQIGFYQLSKSNK